MSITPEQLALQVTQLCERRPETRVVGIHAPHWRGGDSINAGAATFRVAWCRSALAVSEQLAALGDGERLVVLTPLDGTELGDDVLARLARRRLIHPDRWQLVRDAYRVTAVDPRLPADRWMAEALLAAPPPPRTLPAKVLDAGAAWRQVLDHFLGLADGSPDADAVVRWSVRPDAAERFAALPAPLAEAVRQRLEGSAGSLGALLAGAVAAGNARELLPIGLACEVLFSKPESAELTRAAVRLEPLLGGADVDPARGREWAACARRALRKAPSEQRGEMLERTERLLAALKVERWAERSAVLPAGLDARLDRFADAAQAALAEAAKLAAAEPPCARVDRFADAARAAPADADKLAVAERSYDRLRAHDACGAQPERMERLEMALRLLRSLSVPDAGIPDAGAPARAGSAGVAAAPASAAAMMEHHAAEGAFEDWARRRLLGGDAHAGIAALYRAIYLAVRGRREQRNRSFAARVSAWTARPAAAAEPDLLPIERCLAQAVAPLARSRPVLALVLDAMDAGIFEELAESLRALGWRRQGGVPRAALAALPTVTQASRMTLMAGAARQGEAPQEKAAFARHPELLAASQRGRPPVLFHKAGLLDDAGLGLAAAVREALGDRRQKVVGVVLNAVDDHLAKSEQLQLLWRCDRVRLLPELLHEAHAAGRVVALTSDHGHVPEMDGVKLPGGDDGRWRAAGGPPADPEIELAGDRVRAAAGRGRIILPWSETVRYGQRKNGYHGGLTLQEAVVPIGVFAPPGDTVKGLRPAPAPHPPWWRGRSSEPEPAGRAAGAAPQLDLFDNPV